MALDKSFTHKLYLAKIEVKSKIVWKGVLIQHKVSSMFTGFRISGTISAN